MLVEEMKRMITIEDIQKARRNLAGIIRKTPLDYSTTFSRIIGKDIYLKCENLQKTGSFKIRGAANKILSLSEEERQRGVIAASAGNHAQGVASGATAVGISSTIFMPEGAPISKITATRGYGAEVILHGEAYDDAYQKAKEVQQERGATFIHAFDDPDVIAGQGTMGLEILEELPEIDTLIAPIGGGGLISGLAIALKEARPQIKVVGVQAAGCPSSYVSRKEHRICPISFSGTIADGIAVKTPGSLTFPLIEAYVDDIVTVEDEEIANAILMLLERAKLVTEGSGAVSLAALLHNKVNVRGKKVVTILSGGNIDANMVSTIINRGLVKAGRYVRINTTLPDKPGYLRKILNLIADLKANVFAINHERLDVHAPLGETEVYLTLETRDHDHIRRIIEAMAREGYKAKILD